MHLSHVHEDLEAWYINFDFDERVTTAFRPNLQVKHACADRCAGADGGLERADVRRDYRRAGRIGHSASIQTTSRLRRRRRRPRRHALREGHRDPGPRRLQHARQPVPSSERPDEIQAAPAAGVHFVVFNPSSDDFHRNRLAMDGVLPGGKLPLPAARPRPGVQRRPPHDAPSELPRAAAAPPQLPARRDLMDLAAEIVMGVFVILLAIFIGALFVWAARKDGEEDQALQKRLGIKRRTRLGR